MQAHLVFPDISNGGKISQKRQVKKKIHKPGFSGIKYESKMAIKVAREQIFQIATLNLMVQPYLVIYRGFLVLILFLKAAIRVKSIRV